MNNEKKSALLAEMDAGWTQLNDLLDQIEADRLLLKADAVGWTTKDHLSHLMAWEQSVLFFLRGQPRHAGLGIEQDLYETHDFDAMNVVIQQRYADWEFAEVRRAYNSTHEQLVAEIQQLSDEDLAKPYEAYLPDEAGKGDSPLAFNVIYGNTVEHYKEHSEWISALVAE